MPTGYTHKIPEGESFEEFVWSCARAMGFLVHMRDDPSDSAISAKPGSGGSDYYSTAINEAEKKLADFLSYDQEKWETYLESRYQEERSHRVDRRAKKRKTEIAYKAMLQKVQEWDPPDGLDGLKKFMTNQIQQSIEHDCFESEYDDPDKAVRSTKAEVLTRLRTDLEYYRKNARDNERREAERLSYIHRLDDSVPRPKRLIPKDEL